MLMECLKKRDDWTTEDAKKMIEDLFGVEYRHRAHQKDAEKNVHALLQAIPAGISRTEECRGESMYVPTEV